ncbi:hypothetical protein T12_9200 [Trichinella patagoniensis]|uniref:Uncharacterized protein n=1 Tax=Trichinella patagoniensis TaxID=990121 RepID=A0A0V1A5K6_9BILA|nr:hypothetical protein T12_9200 [Trichinella patagoniensis]
MHPAATVILRIQATAGCFRLDREAPLSQSHFHCWVSFCLELSSMNIQLKVSHLPRKRIQSITTDILERCDQKFLDKDLRRPGIEPGSPAWQASILPLNHRRCCDKDKAPYDIPENHLYEIIYCYYATRRSLK